MALNFLTANQLFKHSKAYNQGGGRVRKGMASFVVAQDGSGDYDTIQEALDSLPGVGGAVFVKEGTYTLTTTLTVGTANTILFGAGYGTKITTTSNISLVTSTKNRVVVQDLSLVGNSTGSSQKGINFTGNECTVKNCWILDMGDLGISFTGDNGLITGCFIKDCEDDCIYLSTCNYTRISDCFIDDSTDNGIYIVSGLGNSIIGCQIVNHGNDGVELVSTTQNMITGCYIFSNGDNNTNGDGVEIKTGAHDNCITCNSLHTNDGYGVDIQAGANKNIIMGNSILNNEDGAINDSGTSTFYQTASDSDPLNVVA